MVGQFVFAGVQYNHGSYAAYFYGGCDCEDCEAGYNRYRRRFNREAIEEIEQAAVAHMWPEKLSTVSTDDCE